MTAAGSDVIESTDRSDDLESLGVEAIEVRDSAVRNVVIAVIGLVLVMAALVPLVYGAVWVGSIVYAAVVSLLAGGPDAAAGTAV